MSEESSARIIQGLKERDKPRSCVHCQHCAVCHVWISARTANHFEDFLQLGKAIAPVCTQFKRFVE